MPLSRLPGSGARHRAVSRALAAAALLAAAASAYVGQWHSYLDNSRVVALAAHQGYVYAGTQGGVRRIDPGDLSIRDYGNLDGLSDPWIVGLASDSSGVLWAGSRDGYLYALPPGKNSRWEIRSRSFAAESWTFSDRAMLAAGSCLYLGSTKGLAIFDTRSGISQLNVTRFGSDLDVQVYSLLRREDTLYIGTSAGAYKARIYFKDPLSPPRDSGYANPADYQQWSKVTAPPGSYFNYLVDNGGVLFYSPGTVLFPSRPGDVFVQALNGSPLQIGSQVYPDWIHFTSAVNAGGKVFAGGDDGMVVSSHPSEPAPDAAPLDPLPSFSYGQGAHPYPRDTIANIGASNGQVWGQSPSGVWRLDASGRRFVFMPAPIPYGTELYTRSLRNTRVDAKGRMYIGSWGGGVLRNLDTLIPAGDAFYRPMDTVTFGPDTLRVANRLARPGDSTKALWDTLTPARDTTLRVFDVWDKSSPGGGCIQEILPGYLVVQALGTPQGDDLFFASFASGSSGMYQLIHVNTASGKITCIDSTLVGASPHGVEILARTRDSILVGVAGDRGVNFVVLDEGPDGPVERSAALWTVSASSNEAWDLATDRWGRPWALINDQLAYLDSLDSSPSKRLKAIDNFIGSDCKSLEADPAGLLWVGCSNGLFQVRTDAGGNVASVRRYTLDDGLPSLYIYDVNIDPANGRVWVATDRGVAMLESASQPAIPGGEISKIVPYPNPFRPGHAFVVFRGLPSNSTLRIHEPSGRVVRIFRPRDLLGAEAQWDGKNEEGKPVPPGVYMFSVTSGSAVERGKVIVAR